MIDNQTLAKVALALQSIPADAEQLAVESVEGTGKGISSRSKPQSRPPLPWGPLDDLQASWAVLGTWARDWHEFGNHTGHLPEPTWRCVCDYLLRHWPNMAEQHPAADEFADEVLGVDRRLRAHQRADRTWLPLPGSPICPIVHPGEDTSCGGLLLEHQDERRVRCKDCAEEWTRSDYPRLAELLGVDPQPVTIKAAATYAQMPLSVLRMWISRGWVTPVEGLPVRVMYADVAAMRQRSIEGI